MLCPANMLGEMSTIRPSVFGGPPRARHHSRSAPDNAVRELVYPEPRRTPVVCRPGLPGRAPRTNWSGCCSSRSRLLAGTNRTRAESNSTLRALPSIVLFSAFVAFAVVSAAQGDPQVRNIYSIPMQRPVKLVLPTYPKAARQAHIAGTVSLRCLIKPDGNIGKIVIQEGQPLLAHSAIKAVSQWRYKPVLVNGQAVRRETIVQVVFQLPKEGKQANTK